MDGGENRYFSYDCIHKPCMIGIFGSILGLGGYTQKFETPEYYSKLSGIKIAIQPLNNQLQKTFTIMSNTTGYANDKSNFIWDEEMIINPKFNIFLKIENEITEKLANAILNGTFVYLPYLGKNEYPAEISNAYMVEKGSNNKIITLFNPKDCKIEKVGGWRNYRIPVKFNEMWQYELQDFNFALDGEFFSVNAEPTSIGALYWI